MTNNREDVLSLESNPYSNGENESCAMAIYAGGP